MRKYPTCVNSILNLCQVPYCQTVRFLYIRTLSRSALASSSALITIFHASFRNRLWTERPRELRAKGFEQLSNREICKTM